MSEPTFTESLTVQQAAWRAQALIQGWEKRRRGEHVLSRERYTFDPGEEVCRQVHLHRPDLAAQWMPIAGGYGQVHVALRERGGGVLYAGLPDAHCAETAARVLVSDEGCQIGKVVR